MSSDAEDSVSHEHGAAFNESLVLARSGAGDCVGDLLERCRPYLLSIAEAELPSDLHGKLGASDLVQDTLARGMEHFGDFRGTSEEELAGWLRRILLNRLSNVRRLFDADKRNVQREQPPDSGIADSGQPTPSGVLSELEDQQRLEQALSRLPEDYQKVIRLRHIENKSFAEIAVALGRTENAAGKLWVRAVQRLREEFGNDSSTN